MLVTPMRLLIAVALSTLQFAAARRFVFASAIDALM
jgi:hypothetical protein